MNKKRFFDFIIVAQRLIKINIKTKKYNLILSKSVAGNILSHIADMLSETNIRLHTSCLENKINQQIFNKKINIIEEPTNKNYPGYRLFDNEGTETKEKSIVKDGKLVTYLSNIKEAKMNNSKSTGNGYESIMTRNMHIQEGNISPKEMLQRLNKSVDFMKKCVILSVQKNYEVFI